MHFLHPLGLMADINNYLTEHHFKKTHLSFKKCNTFQQTCVFLGNDTEPCATIRIWSTVVHLGSPVSATCVIRKNCPLVIGQAVQIEWHVGSRSVPGSPVADESDWVSRVVVSSFNHTKAVLTCGIKATSQIVAGKEIQAGCEKDL